MSSFNPVTSTNSDYECQICQNTLSGPLVAHEGGEEHPFHVICAKFWANKAETCAICREAIDLTSILSKAEIAERGEHLQAEELDARDEQKENDAAEAARLARAFREEDAALYGGGGNDLAAALVLHHQMNGGQNDQVRNDAALAQVLQNAEGSGINPCHVAGLLVVAMIIGSIAGKAFL